MPLLYSVIVSKNSTILAEYEVKKRRYDSNGPPVTDMMNVNFSSFLSKILPKISDDMVEKQSFTLQG